ncbi:hypothetical protein [Candidatus Solirubrobacter pratensis]|uniref:hypothetical protein n=1 Tax=Candidatus Solirubrobacter pratensis TaxID=1298857 RepID=UPI00040D2C21|nr:hypothetical protein [Candidatus Solirubrobacter pratensis]
MARPARHLALLAAAALAVTACGSKDEGISGGGKVIGRTVTVYSIAPDPSGAQRDLVDGEKLALSEAHGRAGALSVNFSSLDAGDGSDEQAAAAARRAINDPQIIAAVADATPVTVPLFNAAGILQVAPAGDTGLAHDAQANPSGHPTLAPPPPAAVPPDFDARFRAAFGRAPQPTAKAGYRAMRGIIAAVANASSGNDRTLVIAKYLAESPAATR